MSPKREENQPTVTRNRAIKIFEALGFKTAGKWDAARCQKKVNKLHSLIEGADLDDKTQKRVDAILKQQQDGKVIVKVVDPDNAAADKQADKEVKAAAKREVTRKAEKKDKTKKKEKKASKKADKGKDSSKAEKKDKSKKAEKKEKKPGVIMSMLEFVRTQGPISEKKILALLKKRFPDKNPESMERTIPQIPGYLVRKKNIDVIGKDDKGRYSIKK